MNGSNDNNPPFNQYPYQYTSGFVSPIDGSKEQKY